MSQSEDEYPESDAPEEEHSQESQSEDDDDNKEDLETSGASSKGSPSTGAVPHLGELITSKPISRNFANTKHPSTADMVKFALNALQERNGSSIQAIKKYITANYNVDIIRLAPFLRKYIIAAVVAGKLIQTKGKGFTGSFKLAPETKKKAPKVAKKPKSSKDGGSKEKVSKEKAENVKGSPVKKTKTAAATKKISTKQEVTKKKTPVQAQSPESPPKKAPPKKKNTGKENIPVKTSKVAAATRTDPSTNVAAPSTAKVKNRAALKAAESTSQAKVKKSPKKQAAKKASPKKAATKKK